MVVLVVRHQEMPESSECRRNFLVCISEMEKRVPGARLWCSLSPDHAFLGLSSLLLACQSDWKSSPRQHRMPGLSWLLASFSKGLNLLLSSSSSFLFVVDFWRKSPWKCPPSLPHSSSLLCPLPPAPIEQAVPLVPIHWDNWWFPKLSSACSPEKAAHGIGAKSRVCCPCCPSPSHPLPRIPQGVCEAEIAFFS